MISRFSGIGILVFVCACIAASGRSGKHQSVAVSQSGYYPVVGGAILSHALDRIDQRSLPLDSKYVHRGTGRGVTAYVFDGGILASHPELEGRVRRGFNAFPGEQTQCNDHGTAVASAIGGKTLGVASDVDIVDVKIISCANRTAPEQVLRGTQWVLSDREAHPGPAVANWSFTADSVGPVLTMDRAVKLLTEAGVTVVVSAGNVNMNACRISPANAPGAIVAGELTTDDQRAPSTAWGPCVDVYAPGEDVLLPSFDDSLTLGYKLWNGTSLSAGYVSGAVALYLERYPNASTAEVLAHIRQTATRDAVGNSRSPFSFLLYVGVDSSEQPRP